MRKPRASPRRTLPRLARSGTSLTFGSPFVRDRRCRLLSMPRTTFLLPLTLRTSPLLVGLLIPCLLPSCTLLDLADEPKIAEAAPLPPPEPDFPELGLNRGEEAQTGIMSWYSVKTNRGTATASGEKFCDKGDTAAHRTLPFGTYVEVVNLSNNKSAVLRINDRGPFTKGRVIDVSIGAAKKLDFVGRGITQCEVRVLVPAEVPQESEEEAPSPIELAEAAAAAPKPEFASLASLSWLRPRPSAPRAPSGTAMEKEKEKEKEKEEEEEDPALATPSPDSSADEGLNGRLVELVVPPAAPSPDSSPDGEAEGSEPPASGEPDETASQPGIDSPLSIGGNQRST